MKEEQIHFQNSPFYETGTIEKNPMRAADVQKTVDLLNEIKPYKFIVPAISPIHVVLLKYIINQVPAYTVFLF